MRINTHVRITQSPNPNFRSILIFQKRRRRNKYLLREFDLQLELFEMSAFVCNVR